MRHCEHPARRRATSRAPPLFDGGLQIFLFNLLKWADLFAVPRCAEDVTFVKPPSGPRITCHVTKPEEDWLDVKERGQYSVRLGERSAGSIGFYDNDTCELVAYIGKYTYFTSNPRWNDALDSKHVVSWQPKSIPDGLELDELLPPGEIGPAELVSALQRPASGMSRSCRVLEVAGDREPDGTALKQCLACLNREDAQTDYWPVSDSQERAGEHFEDFHSNDAALRFKCLERLIPLVQAAPHFVSEGVGSPSHAQPTERRPPDVPPTVRGALPGRRGLRPPLGGAALGRRLRVPCLRRHEGLGA